MGNVFKYELLAIRRTTTSEGRAVKCPSEKSGTNMQFPKAWVFL